MATPDAVLGVSLDLSAAERQINDFFRKSQATLQPLGKIQASASQFDKSLEASNARVIAFGASAGLVLGVERAFTSLVKTTVQVEKILTDINVILGTNQAGLKQFGASLFDIARNTGQSFDAVGKAALEFSRQGLNMTETLKRTRDALVLTRLTGLDAKSAVEDITAAINSFNKTVLDSTSLVNKLATVDAAFAVSSADLAEAIKRVGSTAQDAGVGINELIALVTTAQQITSRGGAVIGNAFKTIFTKVTNPEVLDQLDLLGVKVRDAYGQMLPAIDVLKNFANSFDTLSAAQKSQAERMVGNLYQINILKATLGDLSNKYGNYNKVLEISTNATDAAIQRNERLNQTLAAIANRTSINLTQIGAGVGETTVKPALSRVLTATNTIAESFQGITQDTGYGKGVGALVGKSILEGLGEFFAGPGLAIVGLAFGKLTLSLGKYVLDAARSFIGINQGLTNQIALQEIISKQLASQPGIIEAIRQGRISALSVEQQILASLETEVILSRELASLSGGMAKSAVRSGFGIDGMRGLTNSKLPRFADPIREAIHREIGGGISASQIRIGSSVALKGPMNPGGIGVYNTIDEPHGLSQGISRAISEGRSPRSYNVPNFASPGNWEYNQPHPLGMAAELQKGFDLDTELDALKKQLRLGAIKLKDFNESAKKLAQTFDLSEKSYKEILRRGKLVESYAAKNPFNYNYSAPGVSASPLISMPGSYSPIMAPFNINTHSSPSFPSSPISSYNQSNFNKIPTSNGALGSGPWPVMIGSPEAKAMAAKNSSPSGGWLRNHLRNNSTSYALGAGIGGPMLGAGLGTLFQGNDESHGGRVNKAWGGAIGDVLSYGGMGLSFGLLGGVVGGTVGLGAAGFRIYQAKNDYSPDYNRAFSNSNATLNKKSDTIRQLRTITETFKASARGEVQISPMDRRRLQNDYQAALLNLDPSEAKSMHEALTSGDEKRITDQQGFVMEGAQKRSAIDSLIVDLDSKTVNNDSAGQLAGQYLITDLMRGGKLNDLIQTDDFQKQLGGFTTPGYSQLGANGQMVQVPGNFNAQKASAFLADQTGLTGIDRENFIRAASQRKDLQGVLAELRSRGKQYAANGARTLDSNYDAKVFARRETGFLAKSGLMGEINANQGISGLQNRLLLDEDSLFSQDLIGRKKQIDMAQAQAQMGKGFGSIIMGGSSILKDLGQNEAENVNNFLQRLQNVNNSFSKGAIGLDDLQKSLEEFADDLENSEISGMAKASLREIQQDFRNGMTEGRATLTNINNAGNAISQAQLERTRRNIETNRYTNVISNIGNDISYNNSQAVFSTQKTFGRNNIRKEGDLSILQQLSQSRFLDSQGSFAQEQARQRAFLARQTLPAETSAQILNQLDYKQLPNASQDYVKPYFNHMIGAAQSGDFENIKRGAAEMVNDAPNDQARGEALAIQYRINQILKARERKEFDITQSLDEEIAQIQLRTDLLQKQSSKARMVGLEMYKSGTISGATYRSVSEVDAKYRIDSGDYRPSDVVGAFGDELKYNTKDLYKDLDDGARELSRSMKSSFKDAFHEFATGAKSSKDAFRNFGISILDQLATKAFSSGTDMLINGIAQGVGALGSAAYSYFGNSSMDSRTGLTNAYGGLIQKYASGGEVLGGSGVTDDVPAMLSNGEYVIRKSSVNKYGRGFLHSLNQGGAVKMARGGRTSVNLKNDYIYEPNNSRPLSGREDISSALSNFAVTNEDSPANMRRMEKEARLHQYVNDYWQYQKYKSDTLAAYNQKKNRQTEALYIQAGISLAGAGVSYGASSYKNSGSTGSYGNTANGQFPPKAYGGLITHFAGGGMANGNNTRDNIPALLMGGEFVVNRASVDKYGAGLFNQINNGTLKMAAGGMVGSYDEGKVSENGTTSTGLKEVIDILTKIFTKIEKESLSDSGAKNRIDETKNQNSSVEVVNNITIQSQGNNSQEGDKKDKSENLTDEEKGRRFGEIMKSICLKVITEQQRPGGLLAK